MSNQALREQVLYLLNGGGAHLDFEKAIADISPEMRGATIEGVPQSPWQLLEHLRICQWDILEFSRNPDHVSPDFPDGLWPDDPAPPNAQAWEESIESFRNDSQEMKKLVSDLEVDLFAQIPHGEGQTVLREALLVADHNAYHLGQLVILRKALGIWNE